ncbi:MAG: hypothetical protein JXN64_14755 [Spirochaetes bacterium]|nr:hypothetical protein [Spirochaetota bacterium]
MNLLIKIVNTTIITINKLIDGLNKKTIDTIKISFFGLVIILVILGIYIGYNSGKSAAKQYGKPITENTNELFDPLIKKSRDIQYGSMLESELIKEQKDIRFNKVEFPANENLKTEIGSKTVDPDPEIKKESALYMDSQKIADIKRTDEKINEPDIREIKKELPKNKINEKAFQENSPMDNSKIIEK